MQLIIATSGPLQALAQIGQGLGGGTLYQIVKRGEIMHQGCNIYISSKWWKLTGQRLET